MTRSTDAEECLANIAEVWARLLLKAQAEVATQDDWSKLDAIRAQCLTCGECPHMTAKLLIPPAHMLRPPFQPGEPLHELPARHRSRA